MDRTTSADYPLFAHTSDSEPLLPSKATQVPKPRNSTRRGDPIARKSSRSHAKTHDRWMETEPDYKSRTDYREALNEVKREISRKQITTYGHLTRHLRSVDETFVQHLDSILDDIGEMISYDKFKPAPSLITVKGILRREIDFREVFA